MKTDYLYKITGLNFAYLSQESIFENCNFQIGKNKTTLITGENGSGKTTLCRLLSGLLQDFEGEIQIDGNSINSLSVPELSTKIIYIKQGTVENLIGTTPFEDLGIWQHKFRSKDNEEKKFTRTNALHRFHLQDYAQSPVWEMSSGQIKRIGLSALLLANEQFWMLDEPSAGLDDNLIKILLNILRERKTQNLGTLILSHRQSYFKEIIDTHLNISDKNIQQV
ncbi:MAG: ABC transporter ATP-binding protein [Candidatus Cloacimonadota bacterium]|nr:ABC transporter ATP-binding protein [Candidatus Cloacimonadota bacterium]